MADRVRPETGTEASESATTGVAAVGRDEATPAATPPVSGVSHFTRPLRLMRLARSSNSLPWLLLAAGHAAAARPGSGHRAGGDGARRINPVAVRAVRP